MLSRKYPLNITYLFQIIEISVNLNLRLPPKTRGAEAPLKK